jgi:hypothetical protein
LAVVAKVSADKLNGRLPPSWVTADLRAAARVRLSREPDAELLMDALGLGVPDGTRGRGGADCPLCGSEILISAQGRCRKAACVRSTVDDA